MARNLRPLKVSGLKTGIYDANWPKYTILSKEDRNTKFDVLCAEELG
jgi:hypothetical protein